MSDMVPAWALAGHAEMRALLGEENATTQRRLKTKVPVAILKAGPIYDARDFGITEPDDADTTPVNTSLLGGTSEAARACGTSLPGLKMRQARGTLPMWCMPVRSLACTFLFEITRLGDTS